MIYLVSLFVVLFCQALDKNMTRFEFNYCDYSYLDNKNMISRYNRTNNFYNSNYSTSLPNTTLLMSDLLVVTPISPTITQFNRILGTNATTVGDVVVIFLIQLMGLLCLVWHGIVHMSGI